MTSREWESTLNVRLADALRRYGLDARPEVMQPGQRRIDVVVRIGPAVIAVEAEVGQTAAKEQSARDDADARLKQGLAQCAVALCYPEDTTEVSLPTAALRWAVRDGRPTAAWTGGGLEQLVSVIRLAPAQLGDPDTVAAVLSGSLNGAVLRLNETQKQQLARALDLPPQTRNKRPVRHPWDAPAKRALLVVATAVMFHSRLDAHLPTLRPEQDNRENPPIPFAGDWPPLAARRCAESAAPIQNFRDSWNQILALDYKPIFQTGRAALGACPADPAFGLAVYDTARAALVVSENIASLRHDLLGRIFHTVLDTARYDGSFYTTTPAATLLAVLALTEELCDWTDPEAISRLRITDPACGTGTLLMAAAERIRDLAPQSRDDSRLAAALIEQVLAGYDVNLTATHMAATTLGLLSPTTQFQKMKIWRTLLGVDDDGIAHLGSLEFLDQKPMLLPWPNGGSNATQVNGEAAAAAAEPSDLVIMNPPFTRDSLRHDQFSDKHERKIKDREKQIFSGKPVHLSGNSGAFLYLADYLRKADNGSIASVLPLVAATAYSGAELRRYLAGHYHIETIVTSHDPGRIYFSENTNIGELLLVCRTWGPQRGPKPPTRIVNLARNPSTPAEAFNVARAIRDVRVAAQGYGTAQEWPEGRIAAGDWGGVQFLSPALCEGFVQLRRGGFFPVAALGRIAEVGPAGRRTQDAFARSDLPNARGQMALWDHKTDVTQSMAAKPDAYIEIRPGKEHLAESYWNQRGCFLLPQRLFLPTTRVLSVRLELPGLGSAWVPCRFDSAADKGEDWEKALCAYLNSSIGILSLLGDRSNKKPTYPNFSLDDLRRLPVPDFDASGQDAVAILAAAYDEHSDTVMRPLPQLNDCPARQALDAAVIAALGLERETLSTIRRELAMEPSVTGRRYAGAAG